MVLFSTASPLRPAAAEVVELREVVPRKSAELRLLRPLTVSRLTVLCNVPNLERRVYLSSDPDSGSFV